MRGSSVLKFNRPVQSNSAWESALPLGNGEVGALVQGGVKSERIMLTDVRAVWKGNVGVLPDISDKLKDVRSHVSSKNPVMAGIVMERAMESKKYVPSSYAMLPVADLVIEQILHSKITNYSRALFMDTAEVGVNFTANSTKFERNSFVSAENGYFVCGLSKTGNANIDIDLKMVAHDKKTMVMNEEIATGITNENILLSGSLIGYEFEAEGKIFGAMARVLVDLKAGIRVTEDALRIEEAEKVLIIVKTYVGKAKDKPAEKVRAELLALRQMGYEKLFKSHVAIFQKWLSKTEIEISKEKEKSIENLIQEFGEDSTLIYEKLFNLGKYLYATGFKEVSGAPMVSGLWGQYYHNKNASAGVSTDLSAIYSPALMMGHDEKVLDMLNYFEKYQDDFKKSAYRIYKSKGYMVPETFVMGSGLPASIKAENLSTITGSAVVANLFYEYFLYTKDTKYLKNVALPFMINVADFYMNYFYKNESGTEMSCPSFAPLGKSKYFESRNVGVYENSTSDFVVARTLLLNIMNLANVYSINVEKIVDYQNFLNSLPVMPLEKNAIKEYRNEENSVLSSGFMHMYEVFGTREIQHNGNVTSLTPYLNTLLFKVDKALFAQGLVAIGRLAESSAILGQANVAYGLLQTMIKNFLSGNLMFLNFDTQNLNGYSEGDNYFNIAGNMLLCSTMIESFVLDYQNNISILPAKPASIKEGKISGVNTRQNVVVDVEFDDKRGSMTVVLKATKSTKLNLILPKGVKKVKNYAIDANSPRIDNIMLSSGKSISFDIKY